MFLDVWRKLLSYDRKLVIQHDINTQLYLLPNTNLLIYANPVRIDTATPYYYIQPYNFNTELQVIKSFRKILAGNSENNKELLQEATWEVDGFLQAKKLM